MTDLSPRPDRCRNCLRIFASSRSTATRPARGRSGLCAECVADLVMSGAIPLSPSERTFFAGLAAAFEARISDSAGLTVHKTSADAIAAQAVNAVRLADVRRRSTP